MVNPEKLGVAAFILLFLGGSYLAAVWAFASTYLIPATIAYLVVAVLLVARLLTEKEND